MKKTVLVLGSTGMLGSECYKLFSSKTKYITIGTSRLQSSSFHKCSNVNDLTTILDKFSVDYIINCIGIIKPYIKESDLKSISEAIRINSIFPHEIAQIAANRNIRTIQIATDCVFSGSVGGYSESDVHDAMDLYGRSKSLGEVKNDLFLNLRTSIVGREQNKSSSLLEWFLSKPSGKVNGFTNHYWNGVTTYHFALICAAILDNEIKFSGLKHILPSDSITKANLLNVFRNVYNRADIEVTDTLADVSVDRTLRTLNSDTNNFLWELAGYKTPPTIKQMIEEYCAYTS